MTDDQWLELFQRHIGDPKEVREMVEDRGFLQALSRLGTVEEAERIIKSIGPVEDVQARRDAVDQIIRRQKSRARLAENVKLFGGYAKHIAGGAVTMAAAWTIGREAILWFFHWLTGGR